jgi:hypothetical protein
MVSPFELTSVFPLPIPRTAGNLADYHVVWHGHYAIAGIFTSRGMYGR